MKTMLQTALLFMLFLVGQQAVYAQQTDTAVCPYDCCRPDGHAPLGVMSDHVHGKGEWGFSYSYTNTMFNGSQSGTQKLNDADVYGDYMMSPEKMSMQMHMFMLMYGLTDRLSLMAMFGYTINTMSMNMISPTVMDMPGMNMGVMPGGQMNTSAMGFSDTRLSALYKLYDRNRQRIVVGLGVGIPTGSISASGVTMLGGDERLPYSMQIGTGTWNLLPSIAYTGQSQDLSWGAMGDANLKPGMNGAGYAFGNEYHATAWASYRMCSWLSASLRAEEVVVDKISGYDPDIAILMNNDPCSNALNSGGQKTSLYFGLNLYKPKMPCRNNRLMFEYGVPLYQYVNGIQMPNTGTLLAGWQYNF
jgi:hypothetical protein